MDHRHKILSSNKIIVNDENIIKTNNDILECFETTGLQ